MATSHIGRMIVSAEVSGDSCLGVFGVKFSRFPQVWEENVHCCHSLILNALSVFMLMSVYMYRSVVCVYV